MKPLDQALLFMSRGWSVIPVGKDKRPLISWKDYQYRKASAEEILAWWKQNPDAQVGIVTGKISNLTVIDVEAGGDFGAIRDKTMTVRTGGGGRHYYFTYDSDFTNMVRVRPLVDVRSEGGYVVAPGSVTHKGSYSVLSDEKEVKVTPMSKETKSFLLEAHTPFTAYGGPAPVDHRTGFHISEGSRNEQLHKQALSLLNKHDQEMAWTLLVSMNATAKPPLEDGELRALFNSALKRVQQFPATNTTKFKQPKQLVENKQFRHTKAREDLARSMTIFKEGKTTGIASGFSYLDMATGGFIAGQSYLIYADTNVGKSMFAVNCLVDLARRGVRCVYFDLENSIEMTMERMILVSNEGELRLTDWRHAIEEKDFKSLEQYASKLEPLLDSLYIWDLNKLTDRFGEITWEGVKKCIEEAVAEQAQIIILDHLHYFSPAETDHAVLGEVARELNNMCAVHGISIVMVAHTKKGLVQADKNDKIVAHRPTIDHISGSGLIAKHCKNIIGIQRNYAATEASDRTKTKVYVDKTKYGPATSFDLKYDEECLIFRNLDVITKQQFDDNKKALDEFDKM